MRDFTLNFFEIFLFGNVPDNDCIKKQVVVLTKCNAIYIYYNMILVLYKEHVVGNVLEKFK